MAWTVDIDGNDITSLCQSITWNPKLNRPASLVARVPGHLMSGINMTGESEMHLTNGSLLFSGPVWYTQAEGDPDATYFSITAYDRLIYLTKRLCKTGAGYAPENWPPIHPPNPAYSPGPCNLADPHWVITDNVTAPAIMKAFIDASNYCDDSKGSMGLTVNSAATGGDDMTGVPAEWPMTIQDMLDLLLSTGQLNILVNPGYGSSTVDLTNGGVVNDLTGSVSLNYQTGLFNSQSADRTQDMEDVTNALWYLLGPQEPQYERDITHWRGSLTPDGPHDIDRWRDPGGHPWHQWPAGHIARWMASRANYGYMQEIQIHDEKEDENDIRFLFEKMWQNEAYLRAVPRTFIGIKPERAGGTGVSFKPGDLISVASGSRLAGGYSGSILVYEYEITIDADGVADYSSILASPDGL